MNYTSVCFQVPFCAIWRKPKFCWIPVFPSFRSFLSPSFSFSPYTAIEANDQTVKGTKRKEFNFEGLPESQKVRNLGKKRPTMANINCREAPIKIEDVTKGIIVFLEKLPIILNKKKARHLPIIFTSTHYVLCFFRTPKNLLIQGNTKIPVGNEITANV